MMASKNLEIPVSLAMLEKRRLTQKNTKDGPMKRIKLDDDEESNSNLPDYICNRQKSYWDAYEECSSTERRLSESFLNTAEESNAVKAICDDSSSDEMDVPVEVDQKGLINTTFTSPSTGLAIQNSCKYEVSPFVSDTSTCIDRIKSEEEDYGYDSDSKKMNGVAGLIKQGRSHRPNSSSSTSLQEGRMQPQESTADGTMRGIKLEDEISESNGEHQLFTCKNEEDHCDGDEGCACARTDRPWFKTSRPKDAKTINTNTDDTGSCEDVDISMKTESEFEEDQGIKHEGSTLISDTALEYQKIFEAAFSLSGAEEEEEVMKNWGNEIPSFSKDSSSCDHRVQLGSNDADCSIGRKIGDNDDLTQGRNLKGSKIQRFSSGNENDLDWFTSAEPGSVNTIPESESDSSLRISPGPHNVENVSLPAGFGLQWKTVTSDSTKEQENSKIIQGYRKVKDRFECDQCSFSCIRRYRMTAHKNTHTGETPFKCDQCAFSSTRRDDLNNHKVTHKVEKTFKCDQCDYAFTCRRYLRRHKIIHRERKECDCEKESTCKEKKLSDGAMVTMHDSKRMNPKYDELPQQGNIHVQAGCGIDGKAIALENSQKEHGGLKTQVRRENGKKPFECDQCGYSSMRRDHFKGHMKNHRGEKPFKCDQCDYACTERGYLKKHMPSHTQEGKYFCGKYTVAGEENEFSAGAVSTNAVLVSKSINPAYESAYDIPQKDSEPLKNKIQEPFKSVQCDYSYATSSDSNQHEMTHSEYRPFRCDECNYSSKRLSSMKIHEMTHTGEKPFKCDQCDYSCRARYSLKDHKITHTTEKPFKCEMCDNRFKTASVLKVHKMIHTGEKPFACDQCDFSCRARHTLKNHKLTHTTEKPFKCDQCDYSCRTRHSLQIHELAHTAENPFKCELCDKSFKKLPALKIHRMTHTGEKPFKCDQCDFSCRASYSLKNHKLRHNTEKPFKCELCHYSFKTLPNLKMHTMNHTGEKPFKCDQCDYSSTRRDHLKDHKIIHTVTTVFQCDKCPYSCDSYQRLKSHLKIHYWEKNSTLTTPSEY